MANPNLTGSTPPAHPVFPPSVLPECTVQLIDSVFNTAAPLPLAQHSVVDSVPTGGKSHDSDSDEETLRRLTTNSLRQRLLLECQQEAVLAQPVGYLAHLLRCAIPMALCHCHRTRQIPSSNRCPLAARRTTATPTKTCWLLRRFTRNSRRQPLLTCQQESVLARARSHLAHLRSCAL